MGSIGQFFIRFAIASGLVVAVASVGVVAGNTKFEREYDKTETVDLSGDVLAPEKKGEPANFLVVGSDTRAIVDDEGEAGAFGDVGGERSDTLMVVHVDPETETGFVVSFPRDTWVQIPGHDSDRLNAAYGLGGPQLVIETLRENFSIDIHHYLEVDFDGFREIVDTIGGVDIQFNAPARDEFSNLDVPDAGCRELDGNQALAYARSRFYEAYDADSDRWRQDPRSDLSRIERQQYFLRSLADAALERGARNPLTAYRLVTDVFDYMKRDSQLELDDVKGLINAFRDLDPASIEMATIPTETGDRGGADVQLVIDEEAAPLLARLRTFGLPTVDLPETTPPGEVRVRVLNGSGERGLGTDVNDGLTRHGFQVVGDAADADRDDYPLTQVRYSPGALRKALTVAVALGTPNVTEAREGLPEGLDVEVIVGEDWNDLVAPLKDEPAATTTPTPAPTLAPGATTPETSAAPTTTTTTRPVSASNTDYVPVDPETGGPLVGCP